MLKNTNSFKEKLIILSATWFGTGLIPPPKHFHGFAGTYGSFFSIPFCYLVITTSSDYFFVGDINAKYFELGLRIFYYLLFCFFIFALGLAVIDDAERLIGPSKDWRGKIKKHDLNQVVIDEVLGMLISCFPIVYFDLNQVNAPIIIWYIIAFIFFRFFDIVKIWPANYFDKKQTPVNIMLDDVVAGIYSAIALSFVILLSE